MISILLEVLHTCVRQFPKTPEFKTISTEYEQWTSVVFEFFCVGLLLIYDSPFRDINEWETFHLTTVAKKHD